MSDIERLISRVRGVLALIGPEHITPAGKRQIVRVLDEEWERAQHRGIEVPSE